ncbi:hypothetical protein ACVXHA_00895 [Escherichia coli]
MGQSRRLPSAVERNGGGVESAVVSSLMAWGVPATHRQALGMLGMHGTYEANMTMHNADVISPSG